MTQPAAILHYSCGDRNLTSKYRLPTPTGLAVNPIANLQLNIVSKLCQTNLTDGMTLCAHPRCDLCANTTLSCRAENGFAQTLGGRP